MFVRIKYPFAGINININIVECKYMISGMNEETQAI